MARGEKGFARVIVGSLLMPALFIGGLATVFLNYSSIHDWYALRNYQPSERVAAYASSTTMTDEGKRIFYISDPEVDEKETFNSNCPFPEYTYVLGCYDEKRVFILNVDEPSLKNVEDVTAAHEMLHAVYKRLSKNETERIRIDALLESQLNKITETDFLDTVKQYREADASVVNNELHSLIATEISDISPELEEYYSRYFRNRLSIVSMHREYSQVFKDIEQQANSLYVEINNLQATINQQESSLAEINSELSTINSQLDSYSSTENIASYNSLIPRQNQLVRSYNNMLTGYNQNIDSYNAKISVYNDIVIRQQDLQKSINSKYKEPVKKET